MSRIKNVKMNLIYGYIGHIAIALIAFASRTIFINILGVTYLGVNGLFANILGLLSFAELGIGPAMTFALYKPVAEGNIEEIKSLMHLYKKAYRWVAIVITAVGLAILPFLDIIIKNPGEIGDISIYYIIFLFNTISSYFVTYKYTLVNAYQKKYIITNITTIFNLVQGLFNIALLLLFRSFMIYLLSTAAMQLFNNIFINIYVNKKYPYLKEKGINKLSDEQLGPIKKNIFALIWHRLARVSILQTDSIIISAFVGVAMVGLVSNYNLLIVTVKKFFSVTIGAVMGSLGNLIATESKEKQYETYKTYGFVMFWLYGFCAVAFFILADSFITLWIGKDLTIPSITWIIIVLDFYLQGNITALWEVKSASGIFRQDRWIVVLMAIINLVISIAMVQIIGITGVFVGTLVTSIVSYILRPRIVYNHAFNKGVKDFYINCLKQFIPVVTAAGMCLLFRTYVAADITWFNLFINAAVVLIVTNLLFYMSFRKSNEFIHVKMMILKNRVTKKS